MTADARRAAPDTTTGYYRGAPGRYGGTGSMAGGNGAGIGAQKMAAKWEPTVRFLLALVVAEVLLYGVVRHLTKHGG